MKKIKQNAYSILEVLIALALITVCLASGAILIFQGQSFSIDTKSNEQAIYLAQNNLENAKKAARLDFTGLNSSSATVGDFLNEIIVEAIDQYQKKVTSRVTWTTDPLRPQKIELAMIVTDWPNAVPPPDPTDTGGEGTSGDWCNPRTLGSVDLGPGNSATDLDVIDKIIYMSASASSSAKPDFFIINATDGSNPVLVSSLDTGPTLNALDVGGGYAYLANNNVNSQLQILNVNDITTPTLISTLKLPGVSGTNAIGNSIFYGYDKIFIGTKKATGPEFHIIDVSNPLAPVALGSKEINEDVNSIYVKDNYVYIANNGDEELKIYDISNPANITQVGGYSAPGDSENGKAIWVDLNNLYFGRIVGGNHSDHHEYHILNITQEATPINLGSKNFSYNINDLRARDGLTFLATSDTNSEFQVWDINNPNNITFCSSFNFPQEATGIDYEDNLVYMSVRSNDAFRIITSSP